MKTDLEDLGVPAPPTTLRGDEGGRRRVLCRVPPQGAGR